MTKVSVEEQLCPCEMACECKRWMQKKGKKGKLKESMEVKLILMSQITSLVICQVLKSGWETWPSGKWMDISKKS